VISTPSGGPVDKAPPVLQRAEIDTTRRQVKLVFDEYVAVVPRGTFYLNPGGVGLSGEVIGKKVVLRYPDSIAFTGGVAVSAAEAVKDITEGNVLPSLSVWIPFDSTVTPDSASFSVNIRKYGTQEAASAMVELQSRGRIYRLQSDAQGWVHFRFLPAGEYRLTAFQDQNQNQTPDPGEWIYYAAVSLREGEVRRDTLYLARWPHYRVQAVMPVHPALWKVSFDALPVDVTVEADAIGADQWAFARSEDALWVWVDTASPLPVRLRLRWDGADSALLLARRADTVPAEPVVWMGWNPVSGRLQMKTFYPAASLTLRTPYYPGDVRCDTLAAMSDTLPVVGWHANKNALSADTVLSGLICWSFPEGAFRWMPPSVRRCHCGRVPPVPTEVTVRFIDDSGRWKRPLIEVFGPSFHVEPIPFSDGRAVFFLSQGEYTLFLFDDVTGDHRYSSGNLHTGESADPLIAAPRKIKISSGIQRVTIQL